MRSPRTGSSRQPGRRWVAWTALVSGCILSTTGCQVEYAGMTLPSGKYMHDDVQYFAPGPNFPWANTQAATQRARMQQMGVPIEPTGPMVPPVPPGAIPPVQNQLGRPTDIGSSPLNTEGPIPPAAMPPGEPAPGGAPNAPPVEAVPPPGGAPGQGF